MNQVIRWSNNDILINNTVRIVEPYHAENVSIDPSIQSNTTTGSKISAKGDNDTKTHIIKLVDKFWSDQSKLSSNIDSTSTASSVP
jgi:regulatory protein YycI of two-component signal transduction system YycFG